MSRKVVLTAWLFNPRDIDSSELRKTAIPAGLMESADKSPPKAPKAPPMAVTRADPALSLKE